MTIAIKMIIIFASIVLLLRKKHSLGAAMIVATLLVALLFHLTVFQVWAGVKTALISPATIKVTLALLLVMVLENTLRKSGLLQEMVDSLRELIPDQRIVMGLLPAIIGFLPSPGGAVFSAPLVAEVGRDTRLSVEKQAFVNYWYRHIWEYFFPLYPGILLTAELLRLSMTQLVANQMIYTLVAVVLGFPAGFRGLTRCPRETSNNSQKVNQLSMLVKGLAPIAVVIVAVLGWGINLVSALAVVIGVLWLIFRYTIGQIGSTLREAFSPGLILMVVSVMIFNEMLNQASVFQELPGLFAQWGLPITLIAALLPFVVGFATGVTQGFVAATFPLLGMLFDPSDLSLVTLAFVSGFAGVMLSPVHLCLVLTVQVFKANLARVLGLLVGPELILIGLAVGRHLLK